MVYGIEDIPCGDLYEEPTCILLFYPGQKIVLVARTYIIPWGELLLHS